MKIVGEHLNYNWSENQIDKAKWMIEKGKNIHELVEEFNRDIVEVIILVDWMVTTGLCEVNNTLGYRIKEEVQERETIKIL